MARNTVREVDNLARVKVVAKAFLKKFGPFIITGLAAVAEHHWLDHNNKSEEDTPRRRDDQSEDGHPIKKLEREIAELKSSLSRKVKDEVQEREAGPSLRIREEIVRERRPLYQREERKQDEIRGIPPQDERTEVRSQREYEEYQSISSTVREPEGSNRSQRFRERESIRCKQHRAIQRRHRRHRPSSVPRHTSHEDNCADKTVQAGKVAAVTGFVEALHVSDGRGDWIGQKGIRVGTAMATSFAANKLRDENDTIGGMGAAVDVGAGLVVSEIVHRSSRRIEEGERDRGRERQGRRWSYCY